MLPVYTAEQMRAIDAAAPTPVEVLIDRAGAAVARAALAMLGGAYGRRVVVIAGKGNNGADGRVAARRLARRGVRVRVLDAEHLAIPAGAAPWIGDVDLVIDAAYGTGFRGTWNPPVVGKIPVLAVDIPSGVVADTGEIPGRVLRAQQTVTFHGLKPGLVVGPGADYAGTVTVADIGLPVIQADLSLATLDGVRGLWPSRASGAHKWRQAVRVVAGSPGMIGAAVLCASAAQRAGGGMVQLSSPGLVVPGPPHEVVRRYLPPTQWADAALEEIERIHALAIGPGLGRSHDTVANVLDVLRRAPCPVVVDGDGLAALGNVGDWRVLAERDAATVLTPHDGEFAGMHGALPTAARIDEVRALAHDTRCVVLLKGPTTVVGDPNGRTMLVNNGDQRLATAGSGDVLTGIIAAALSTGMDAWRAAFLGAWVHGATLRDLPGNGVVAGDLVGRIPAALDDVIADRR